MGFHRDFTVPIHVKGLPNGRKNPGQLSGREHGRSSATEVHGSQRPSCGHFLSRVEAELGVKGAEEILGRRVTVEFEIEGAKMTALPAERNMEVQAKAGVHRLNENGAGLEKSRARTISISSVDARPRLRTCDVQDGCRRGASNICFSIQGLISDSHS